MTSTGHPSKQRPHRRPAFGLSPWLGVDSVVWAAAFLGAVWLRFDFSPSHAAAVLNQPAFYLTLAGTVFLASVVGWVAGIYRGRYIPGSLLETAVLVTVFFSVVVVVFLVSFASGTHGEYPRSTPVVAGAFTALMCLTLRSLVRRRELFGAGRSENAEPVLVFGAGDGGRQLVRQLRQSPVSTFEPVALLDDAPSKQNLVVEGVHVRGTRDDLESVAEKYGAGTLIIAVPSLPSDELISIRDRAEALGMHVLVLPPISSMMRGRVAANELREINVNDLLGRQPARLNQTQIADHLRGKRVLVTGAGGSIGSELCRQLHRFRPGELMMLDRDESGLHATQLSIQDQAMLDGDDTVLASIRDRDAIFEIFEKRRPEIVFHAAALKHMPLLEHYPLEALKTNVLGTLNLLDAAAATGVETFVNISTDKAANPCSALGTSKRVAERLTAQKAVEFPDRTFVSVRFGNVLGSRGSVLTVFEKQIKEGGPITVTDPEVNRFFMTIPEACQLVLQAAAVGETGETLVLDMGDPVKIADVARTLIEQSGKDIEIVYTGLRENEKLAEELFDDTEEAVAGEKHEALSEVRVPSLGIDRGMLESINRHDAARIWLDTNAYEREL